MRICLMSPFPQFSSSGWGIKIDPPAPFFISSSRLASLERGWMKESRWHFRSTRNFAIKEERKKHYISVILFCSFLYTLQYIMRWGVCWKTYNIHSVILYFYYEIAYLEPIFVWVVLPLLSVDVA